MIYVYCQLSFTLNSFLDKMCVVKGALFKIYKSLQEKITIKGDVLNVYINTGINGIKRNFGKLSSEALQLKTRDDFKIFCKILPAHTVFYHK